MQNKNITVSARFRKMTVRAILAIGLFIAVYILLILLAIGFTIACGYGGIMMIVTKPMFLTVTIGAGLVSMGILILIFLIKFVDKKHVVDRSHLIQITREDEPRLFEFINEIVKEVKTSFPKKIYLSSEVNASVFYDSSFWSMLLPVKKNLQIGIGLVNTISVIEFKAILAHEFGHFSQRSMKVGSYVYNVNRIIYNMLYDNESYDGLIYQWGSISGTFSFFVGLAVRLVHGIQWILKKVYAIVNLSYLGLSREMEFHADEVAANVAGSRPLITSLLRADLADHAYREVLNYYNDRIQDRIKTGNIYPQQLFVMNYIGKRSNLPFQNNLPQVSMEYMARYNKSKLVIENQWASHPSVNDRVSALKKLNIVVTQDEDDTLPALSLFNNVAETQNMVTEKIFEAVAYNGTPVNKESAQFIDEFAGEYESNSFSSVFNNYYNNKNHGSLELDKIQATGHDLSINEVYNDAAVDLIYSAMALDSDINTLKQISNGGYKIKSFDYDGIKYNFKDCDSLTGQLEEERKLVMEKMVTNDEKICGYFLSLAAARGRQQEYKLLYEALTAIDKDYDARYAVYIKMINASHFIQQTTPFDIIEQNIFSLKNVEGEFKKEVSHLMSESVYQPELTQDIKDSFEKYLSNDSIYFTRPHYDNIALKVMFTCMNNYSIVLSKTLFRVKKELLEFKVQLVNEN